MNFLAQPASTVTHIFHPGVGFLIFMHSVGRGQERREGVLWLPVDEWRVCRQMGGGGGVVSAGDLVIYLDLGAPVPVSRRRRVPPPPSSPLTTEQRQNTSTSTNTYAKPSWLCAMLTTSEVSEEKTLCFKKNPICDSKRTFQLCHPGWAELQVTFHKAAASLSPVISWEVYGN